MESENDNRVKWLQYANTTILTLILGLAVMIASTVTAVKKNQYAGEVERAKISTVQINVVEDVANLNVRVTTLEVQSITTIKDWVDANYVRKAQSLVK